MQDIHELREHINASFNGAPEAKYFEDVVLEVPHPEWGDDEGWLEHTTRSELWLLAHARWRLDEQKMPLTVSLHGRGVRLTDGDALDVLCSSFDEFDRVLLDQKN